MESPKALGEKFLGSDKAILSHAISMTKLTLPGGTAVQRPVLPERVA